MSTAGVWLAASPGNMTPSIELMDKDKLQRPEIRIGCCVNMIAGRDDRTGAEHAPALAGFGYDYLELPLAEMMVLSDSAFAELSASIASQPISCEASNNFFPKTMRLTGPDLDLPQVVDYAGKALSRAASIGAKYVVFGSGPAKNVPDGFPLEEGYAQIVRMLQQIAPAAGKSGVEIAIEPLRRAECNLINTFAEGCRLAEDVNRKEVKVLVDFYHLTVENEPLENLLAMGDKHLRHIHFANPAGRVFPSSKDKTNYLPFFKTLKEIGYSGRISVEAYTDNFPEAAPAALELLRGCLDAV